MPAAPDETHFGQRTIRLDEKQGLVDDVFHRVAGRYDVMNDLMSFGLHRLWKDALVAKVRPSRLRPFAHIDVAGGTGDVAVRVADAGGPLTAVTVVDVNADMLRVAADRAAMRSDSSRLTFIEGNAEALPLPDSRFDAYTIAFGIRNVPRIERALSEAYRVLKRGGHYLCLEFSRVDLPVIEKIYDAYSFAAIPAIGKVVTGDGAAYRYLVELIRKFPSPEQFADMIGQAGFARVRLYPPQRRDRRDSLGLEALIVSIVSSLGHSLRLMRASFVFAREGAFVGIDPALLPPIARLPLRLANLIAKRNVDGLTGLSRGDRPAGTVLRQARAILVDSSRYRRSEGRPRSRAPARPCDSDEPRDRDRHCRGRVRREGRFPVRELRRADRGGFDRPGPPRRRENRRGRADGGGESAARGHRTAVYARPGRHVFRRQTHRPLGAGVSTAAPRSSRRDARALGAHRDGLPARSGGGVGICREFQAGPGNPRADDRLEPHHARSDDDGMDRRGSACRSRTPDPARI